MTTRIIHLSLSGFNRARLGFFKVSECITPVDFFEFGHLKIAVNLVSCESRQLFVHVYSYSGTCGNQVVNDGDSLWREITPELNCDS